MPQAGKRVATTKIAENRSTTVPSTVRTAEGLDVGDEVAWIVKGGEWVIRPAEPAHTCAGPDVLEEYVGRPCEECPDGTLERTKLDGDDTVACSDCEAIAISLWTR